MTFDATALFNAVQSHAMTLGLFEQINTHEPKSKPGNGLTAAIWVQDIGPVPAGSGLAAATARVVMMVRIYTSFLAEPYDQIDPNMLGAANTLLAAYAGAFTLDGLTRNVDVLGASGAGLSARAGYLTQDKTVYRVMDITLPLIVNDVWTEIP